MKIFISRQLDKNSILLRLRDKGYELTDKSLIDFTPLEYNIPEAFDWVFFYSKNGLNFSLQNLDLAPSLKEKKIACFGPSVAKLFLKIFKKRVDLLGSGEPKKFGSICLKEFAGSTVLFLQAENSLSSIQSTIKDKINCISIPVYKNTLTDSFDDPDPDIIVFTSPMNVDAYLKHVPSIHEQTVIIAIGNTTADHIHTCLNRQPIIAKAPNEFEILNAIQNEISKRH